MDSTLWSHSAPGAEPGANAEKRKKRKKRRTGTEREKEQLSISLNSMRLRRVSFLKRGPALSPCVKECRVSSLFLNVLHPDVDAKLPHLHQALKGLR